MLILTRGNRRLRYGFYSLVTPTEIDDFTVDHFTLVGAGATKAEDSGSMLVTGANLNQTCGLDHTYGSFDPAQTGVVAVLVDRVSNNIATNLALSLGINGSTLSNVNFINDTAFLKGGRWLAANVSEFPNAAAASAGVLRLRELISQNNGVQYRIKDAVVNAKGRPTIVLTFDDGYDTIINTVLPILQAAKMTATHYAAPGLLGTTGHITLANLHTLHEAGWAIGSDSGMNDEALPLADGAAAVTQVNQVRDFLRTEGLTGAEEHLCYSMGTKDQAAADALVAAGYLSARTTEPQSFFSRFGVPVGTAMAVPSMGFAPATTLATALARLDEAKLRGNTQFFHFHDISDSPSAIGWSTTNFTAFIDALKAARNANEVDVLTVSEWWARDSVATAP